VKLGSDQTGGAAGIAPRLALPFRRPLRARPTLGAGQPGDNGLIHECRHRRVEFIHDFCATVDGMWMHQPCACARWAVAGGLRRSSQSRVSAAAHLAKSSIRKCLTQVGGARSADCGPSTESPSVDSAPHAPGHLLPFDRTAPKTPMSRVLARCSQRRGAEARRGRIRARPDRTTGAGELVRSASTTKPMAGSGDRGQGADERRSEQARTPVSEERWRQRRHRPPQPAINRCRGVPR
jgi:hypothetical protein